MEDILRTLGSVPGLKTFNQTEIGRSTWTSWTRAKPNSTGDRKNDDVPKSLTFDSFGEDGI